MRFFAALGLSLAVTAIATSPDQHQADEESAWQKYAEGKYTEPSASDITVVQANKSYTVKLDCVGCPLAVQPSLGNMRWQTLSRDNVLLLTFDIDVHGTALLLNGERVLPLDPMPLNINTLQIAANETFDIAETTTGVHTVVPPRSEPTKPFSPNWGLQYEHALLRMKEPGTFWVQFDVTGWVLEHDGKVDTVQLDKEGQKLVQVLLRYQGDDTQLRIADVQLVERKDRMQPYRMKCGKLAIVQTAYNPTEWDKYGKLGSWSRMPYLVLGKLGDLWLDNFQQNGRVFLLALWLAITVFLVRRWQVSRQQERDLVEEDAEIALPDFQYTIIPVIKIEEYD